MTTSAISTSGLTRHYPGVQALTDLTLDVPAGSVYGFLGPNGAGKTTTLRILAGLTRPTSGSASVAGVPLEAGAAYRREVGFLAQDPRFYDWMTGRETLRFVASTSADASARDEAWITKVLDTVGLDEAAVSAAAERAMQECTPISNVRSSAAYRRDMVGVLTRRAVALALESAA